MTKCRLTKQETESLNELLQDKALDLPPFRREVSHTGHNYDWLQANIAKRNKNLNPLLKQLLRLE